MLYDLHNPTRAARIIYDTRGREIRIQSGQTVTGLDLPLELLQSLQRARDDLIVHEHYNGPSAPLTGAVVVDGMWGIGDNIHQRAVMRELMKKEEVWLSTCHWHIYHDLIDKGLHLNFKETRLRAQAKTIQRERGVFKPAPGEPINARRIKLWYRKDQIDKYGSILQAMAGTCGVDHTRSLDFSLPVPKSWFDKLPAFDTGDKSLLVYRPIVLRREWNSANRNPDPVAYNTLYEAIRRDYFTVSIADLQPGEEWIVGPEPEADVKLHAGELDFEAMAALFRRADLVFANAGFGPVLAQAVATPVVILYGGRESYGTTQRAGAHLAPTLGIDPIYPCDCHTERHNCGDKRVDVPKALERLKGFVASLPRKNAQEEVGVIADFGTNREQKRTSDTLIFATTYVDNPDRQHLTELWLKLTRHLNPAADLLIVDSASPVPVVRAGLQDLPEFELFDFGNNVGHLSRGGKDGWGRAFCKGLDLAVERGYRYVVHIEGDSLFRLPVWPMLAELVQKRRGAASVPVQGMQREIPTWVETGLMFFTTEYLQRSRFTTQYNWPVREVRPTPEKIVFHMLGGELLMLPEIKAIRSDKRQLHHTTVVAQNLDWITHCHNDIWAYDRFFEAAMKEVMPAGTRPGGNETTPTVAGLKLNLGCGTNRLVGWENHDAEVDITKPLPWADGAAEFIFIEHCVEHVGYKQAIGFFEESLRVLHPGGVLRVVVPSIEQILAAEDPAYWEFTKRWGGEATRKGAAKAILFSHGHEMAWTADLMRALLSYAGFAPVERVEIGKSLHSSLQNVEGHGKVIGEAFNTIESLAFEATKPGEIPVTKKLPETITATISRVVTPTVGADVALVVGGALGVLDELAEAERLCAMAGAKPTYFVINDMIPLLKCPGIAVTLHPQKAKAWLDEREKNGCPAPSEVWAHTKGSPQHPYAAISHSTDDWRGSSGLFAVKVARLKGFERILLCGVPMHQEGQHFIRKKPWNAAQSFRIAWNQYKQEIAPFVRSMSGWTAETFGKPSVGFFVTMAVAA